MWTCPLRHCRGCRRTQIWAWRSGQAESLLSLRSVAEVRYLVDGEYAAVYGGVSVMEPYTASN